MHLRFGFGTEVVSPQAGVPTLLELNWSTKQGLVRKGDCLRYRHRSIGAVIK